MIRRAITNTLLTIAAITLVIPAGEYISRIVFRDITTTGDNGSYFAKRWRLKELGKDSIRLNAYRYRDRAFSEQKPPGKYRIIVVGDSITYGQGITVHNRFTNIVEDELNRKSPGFEILNFGRPGAQTVHHLNALGKALRTAPDYVLLQWYINDVEGTDFSGRPRPANLMPSRKHHYMLHHKSALYYLLNSQWMRLQASFGLVQSYEDYMLRRFGDPKSLSSRQAIAALETFIDRAKKAGVPVGIVMFPRLRSNIGDAYPYHYLHGRVHKSCADKSIACLDLLETYAPYADNIGTLHVNPFDAHPNALANKLAAERILEVFGPAWLAAER